MAVPTIQQTVEQALGTQYVRQYRTHVDRVVSALVQREEGLCDEVVGLADENGVDADEAREALAGTGMHTPHSRGDNGGDNSGVSEALARIQQTLDSLTTFARRNGYRG